MSLEDITGIGPAIQEKLEDDGITTVSQLSKSSPTELSLSEKKAQKLIERASQESIQIQTGDEVADQMDSKDYIPSGITGLDDHMNGGWEEGMTVGIYGKSGQGKTQVAMNATVSAVEETGRPALYIETEPNNYRPERLQALSDDGDTQSNVHKIGGVENLEDQEAAYKKIGESFGSDDLSVIVIDSFNSHFRDEFKGRQELGDRAAVMKDHLRQLHRLSESLKVPVLLLLQSYGSPEAYGKQDTPYGGNVMMHNIGYFIRMSTGKGELKTATVENHPGVPDEEVLIRIDEESIETVG